MAHIHHARHHPRVKVHSVWLLVPASREGNQKILICLIKQRFRLIIEEYVLCFVKCRIDQIGLAIGFAAHTQLSLITENKL